MSHHRTNPRTNSEPDPQSLPRWLALALAVVITSIGGALYGSYSQRWGPPPDLVAAGAHLAEMPRQIGSWTLVNDLPIQETALEMLECTGYVHRRYIHQDSGRSISVAVIVGRPGPTAVHTPEVCFASRAYDIEGARQAIIMQAAGSYENSFWRIDFKTTNPFAERMRVYYAWGLGDRWEASSSPRYEFAAAPLLYKIQVSASIAPRTGDNSPDAGREFLEALNKSKWTLRIN